MSEQGPLTRMAQDRPKDPLRNHKCSRYGSNTPGSPSPVSAHRSTNVILQEVSVVLFIGERPGEAAAQGHWEGAAAPGRLQGPLPRQEAGSSQRRRVASEVEAGPGWPRLGPCRLWLAKECGSGENK